MSVLHLAALILSALFAFALPGLLLARLARIEGSPLVTGATGLTLGLVTMPMLCFCVAWVAGTSVTMLLVLAVALCSNAALLAALHLRKTRT